MNWQTTKVIIGREYLTRVKKKSFLITTFVVPILFAALCVLPSVLMMSTKERSQQVAVIDQWGGALSYFEDGEAATYTDFTGSDPEELKGRLGELGLDVLVVVSPMDSVARTVGVQLYSKKPLGVDFPETVQSRVKEAVEDWRVASYGIEDLDRIMKDVKAKVRVTEFTLDDSGNESLSESGIYMAVSMVLGMVIYLFIALFGAMVMSSVIEEKSSRVVEVLISSVKATELMFGKIIGVALVALTQFLMWIVLSGVLISVGVGIFGKNILADAASASDPSAMVQGMGIDSEAMEAMPGLDLGAIMAESTDSVAVAAGEPSQMEAVLNTVRNMPYMRLILCFFIYFILGYLLYASMFAAIGSAVENEGDSQQLQLPLTIPLLIAFLIVMMAFRNPDSGVVVWGSIIPFTSPIVMLARIPYGVPMWQLILSIALLVVTFMGCAWASAKIYKAGILMFGKKSSWKDLWKWLKQK